MHKIFLPKGATIKGVKNLQVGKRFAMGINCTIFCEGNESGSKIVIGENVSLNYGVSLNANEGGVIEIGNNVMIGPMTLFRAANHRFDAVDVPIKFQGHIPGKITIEDDAWLGAHIMVLPDVTIGKASVVGAGSVVTKDVPPHSVVAGNPAQVIKSRLPANQ